MANNNSFNWKPKCFSRNALGQKITNGFWWFTVSWACRIISKLIYIYFNGIPGIFDEDRSAIFFLHLTQRFFVECSVNDAVSKLISSKSSLASLFLKNVVVSMLSFKIQTSSLVRKIKFKRKKNSMIRYRLQFKQIMILFSMSLIRIFMSMKFSWRFSLGIWYIQRTMWWETDSKWIKIENCNYFNIHWIAIPAILAMFIKYWSYR